MRPMDPRRSAALVAERDRLRAELTDVCAAIARALTSLHDGTAQPQALIGKVGELRARQRELEARLADLAENFRPERLERSAPTLPSGSSPLTSGGGAWH